MACIYKITNLINNKIYIGQTIKKLERRINNHLFSKHPIGKAFRKYGKENFKIDILIEGDFNKDYLNQLEIHYIQLFNSTYYKKGYNMTKGGNFNLVTEEGRKKISIAHTGKIISEETKLKMSISQKKNYNEERRNFAAKRMQNNKIMLGLTRSKESINKQKESLKLVINNRTKEERSQIGIKAKNVRFAKYLDIGDRISKGKKENAKFDWDNKNAKPVVQLDVNIVIKIWASAYQAQKEEGYHAGSISRVCRKQYGCITYKGYYWRFATEEEIEKQRSNNSKIG